jgi:hypothetical protein
MDITAVTALVTAIVALIGSITGVVTAIRSFVKSKAAVKTADGAVTQATENAEVIAQHDEAIVTLQNGNGQAHEPPAA